MRQPEKARKRATCRLRGKAIDLRAETYTVTIEGHAHLACEDAKREGAPA